VLLHLWFTHQSKRGRKAVGSIWCVGAGDPNSRPVRDVNARNPRKLTHPSLARSRQCYIRCITWLGVLRGCRQINSTFLSFCVLTVCVLNENIIIITI